MAAILRQLTTLHHLLLCKDSGYSVNSYFWNVFLLRHEILWPLCARGVPSLLGCCITIETGRLRYAIGSIPKR